MNRFTTTSGRPAAAVALRRRLRGPAGALLTCASCLGILAAVGMALSLGAASPVEAGTCIEDADSPGTWHCSSRADRANDLALDVRATSGETLTVRDRGFHHDSQKNSGPAMRITAAAGSNGGSVVLDGNIMQSGRSGDAADTGPQNTVELVNQSDGDMTATFNGWVFQTSGESALNVQNRSSNDLTVNINLVAKATAADVIEGSAAANAGSTSINIGRNGEIRSPGEDNATADGIDIDQARVLIASARTRTTDRPVSSIRNWIRSEAEAGLLWIFRSPLIPEGLYGCVDVGAGTTDVSFFRLRSRHQENAWVKDALGFYSARSSPPAMDALGECLAEIGGGAVSPAFLRGNEDSIIKRHGVAGHECVESVCTQIFDTYCRTWRDAYVKEKRESSWYKYRLFVLGGGSKVDLVAQSLRKSVWPGRLANRDIGNAGFPDDLYDWPDNGQLQPFREDAAFLLVAYGLSYLGADVPIVDEPSKIRPLIVQQRVHLPIDQNEKYQDR